MTALSTCSEPDCQRTPTARGLCATHYSAWHRRTRGRKTFPSICSSCGTSFESLKRDARYCSSGPGSCEAMAKTARGEAGRVRRAHDAITASPTAQDITRYKRTLKADPCAYCGEAGGSTDHIVPRSQGGTSDWTNLTGACNRCNAAKQSLPLLQALLWLPVTRRYHDLRPVFFHRQPPTRVLH